jgi:hypothetical protein
MRSEDGELAAALDVVVSFLTAAPLTRTIAELEHALNGVGAEEIADMLAVRGVSIELLHSATAVRTRLGRINDLIHATAIAVALPRLLEPGETLRRPSLASGNDRSRPFDVETDRRIAEFKLARWDGHDAMRKRQVVKDLVHLAADGRRAELYVVGDRPLRFLGRTTAAMAWALDRSPTTRELYIKRFGSLDVSVPEFIATHAAHVQVIDLEAALPDLFGGSA